MPDAEPGTPTHRPGGGFPIKPLLTVVILLLVAVVLNRSAPRRTPHTPQPLPPLWVEGWLNAGAAPPGAESLRGKVVAVDVWALFCPPCRAAMPELVELNRRFGGREDFVLIGLTTDPHERPEDDLDALRRYVAGVDGMDWPIGYGARLTKEALGVRFIPTLLLFDRDGMSVWRGSSVPALAKAIEAELGS
ncbi:MAG: TlpA disulfide reductase family protein [Planctomycetota bacterium]